MKSIRIAGLCFASMLVVGMALASTASATPLWLVCLEGSGLTKYSSNQCTTAESGGKWQSLGLPAGTTDTVTIRAFSLRLEDSEAGPLKEKSPIKCNGAGSKGKGIIEASGKGQITEAEVESASTNCERLEGPCETGKIEKVKGENLPWKTEIFETESKFETKILAGTAGKEPGWAVTCHTALGSKTDICLAEGTGNEEVVELKNEVTSGVLLVKGTFLKAHTAKCSEASKAKTGHVSGFLAILLTSGNGLSINPV